MSKSTDLLMYSLSDLAALLLKDKGIHEGHYETAIEFQVVVGAVGPSEESVLPGVMLGVKSFGLRKVDAPNPLSVDASVANPGPAKKVRTTRKTAA